MVQNTNPRMIRITPHTDAQIPQPRLLDTAIVERRSKEEEGEGVRRGELGFFFPQSRGLVQSCTSFFNPSLLESNFNEVKRPPSWLILSKKMVFVHFCVGMDEMFTWPNNCQKPNQPSCHYEADPAEK